MIKNSQYDIDGDEEEWLAEAASLPEDDEVEYTVNSGQDIINIVTQLVNEDFDHKNLSEMSFTIEYIVYPEENYRWRTFHFIKNRP